MVNNSQKLIKFRGNDYIVKFPNVGQMIDIENNKMSLTNGRYADMAMSVLKIQIFQLDITDMIAYFAILAPQIKEDLALKNWRDMDAKTAKELVGIFKKEFIPWFKPLNNELLALEDSEELQSESNESETEIVN